MRSLLQVALVALTLVAAGCVSEEAPAIDDASTNTSGDTVYSDDRITIEDLDEDVDGEADVVTLAAPPQWTRGEWWRVELTDHFTGDSYSTYRIVAGAEGDNYLVGMPTHGFENAIMVFHIPGFGQVSKADLSFEIHDCLFEPLKFPLEEGATWNTQFECRDVTATVVEVTDTTASVEIIGNSDYITLTYDTTLRAITAFEKEGYGAFRITDHGTAFHEDKPEMLGQVTVPHMHDVIFQHGRVAGTLWTGSALPTGLGPQTPFDNVEVASTYDRVSFAIILGNLWGLTPAGAAPVGGYYKETATAPDGTIYELEMTPDDNSDFKIASFKHDAPGGTWQFQHVSAGPGIAMAEGIAYHVYDVELPSGRILPSIGEHKHGDLEGHGGHGA